MLGKLGARLAPLVLLVASTMPVAAAVEVPAGSGVAWGSIVSGGLLRHYRAYYPSSLEDGRPHPVVFVLHGGLFGSPAQVANNSRFDTFAERDGFIALYPGGIGNTWNAGTCCGPARTVGADDVGFVRDLLDDVASRHLVDPTRVFATGMSNGGMLAYRLACELSGRVAAVAPVAATMTVPCDGPAPARPVSVLHIHGLADQHVPYEGGVGTEGYARDSRPSVPSVIDKWRSFDGCTGSPVVEVAGAVTTSTTDGCAEGTSVELITIADAGHTWPGGDDRTGLGAVLVDPPNDAVDASAVIADFFSRHGRQ